MDLFLRKYHEKSDDVVVPDLPEDWTDGILDQAITDMYSAGSDIQVEWVTSWLTTPLGGDPIIKNYHFPPSVTRNIRSI